jgi:hypothetical protein
MAQHHYVVLKISVPSTRLIVLRQYFEYFTGQQWSIVDFLNQQIEQFRSAFGPEAISTIQQTGTEEA